MSNHGIAEKTEIKNAYCYQCKTERECYVMGDMMVCTECLATAFIGKPKRIVGKQVELFEGVM